jgi:hypothetical protein
MADQRARPWRELPLVSGVPRRREAMTAVRRALSHAAIVHATADR